MKLICLLVSVYILFLASMPCMDGESCITGSHTDQTSQHDPSGGADHADGCSPFCICSCCSVTVVLNDFRYESTPYAIPVQVDFIFREPSSEIYIPSFWDPPKA